MSRALANSMLVAVAAVIALAAPAHAETVIQVPKSSARLAVDDGWRRVTHTYPDNIDIYEHERGSRLVLTRADIPNPDAWVDRKRQAYVDQVEKGIARSVAGYKRLARKVGHAGNVPALDLEVKTSRGTTLVIRVLLYRTYSVSAGIEVPEHGDVAAARAILKAFGPAPAAAK